MDGEGASRLSKDHAQHVGVDVLGLILGWVGSGSEPPIGLNAVVLVFLG